MCVAGGSSVCCRRRGVRLPAWIGASVGGRGDEGWPAVERISSCYAGGLMSVVMGFLERTPRSFSARLHLDAVSFTFISDGMHSRKKFEPSINYHQNVVSEFF